MANFGKKGWIKLWRSEMDNPLYWSEKFTKWQAWMDLCLLADDQGTVKTSLEALKNRWSWGSKHKVRDFLGTVEGTGLGTVTYTQNKGTLIRINTGNSTKNDRKKKDTQGTVEETQMGLEEVTSKEVADRTSADVRSTASENKKKTMRELLDELGDEYE